MENWWREACLDWCYNRLEDGKFGDQKYLDSWQDNFRGVMEVKNIASILAPWNIQKYKLINMSPLQISDIDLREVANVVLYHFHSLHFIKEYFSFYGLNCFSRKKIIFCNYRMPQRYAKYIYEPYVNHLLLVETNLKKYDIAFNIHGEEIVHRRFSNLLNRILRQLFICAGFMLFI